MNLKTETNKAGCQHRPIINLPEAAGHRTAVQADASARRLKN
jgi:hypothetical protein